MGQVKWITGIIEIYKVKVLGGELLFKTRLLYLFFHPSGSNVIKFGS
jgi:hypothetical protein